MKRFTDLDLRYLDGRRWLLLNEFSFTHQGVCYCVPSGFVTDFASTPRFFWRLFPPTGKYGKAAVIHDYLYRIGAVPRVTKAQADGVFFYAMVASRCDKTTASILFLAVHFFGGKSYHRKRVRHFLNADALKSDADRQQHR